MTENNRSTVIAEAMLADAVAYIRPDTGPHPDHPPVDGGYRGVVAERPALPTDSNERKRTPLCAGCLDYFPAALTALVDRLAGIGCSAGPIGDDAISALRDRDWGTVCALALCDLNFELGHNGDLDNVLSLSDLFTEFPAALAAVAQVSWLGNEKHNPGQPLHHARGKSMDHADCVARHHVERGGFDGPMRHSACKLWRGLAAWQEDLESKGAPKARGAR